MATEIIEMPSQYIDGSERDALRHQSFDKRLLNYLNELGYYHKQVMEKADAAVVFLDIPDGYLGDGIQGSRLVGVVESRFPNTTYVNTNYPHLFTKYPLAEFPEPVNGHIGLPIIDENGQRTRTDRFQRAFFPIAEHRNLVPSRSIDGKGHVSNGPNFNIQQIDLDSVEFTHMFHVMQSVWEVMYGQPLDSLPLTAIAFSDQTKAKSQEVFEALPISDQLNVVIHPDSSNIEGDLLFEGKRWETLKWIDLVRKLPVKYPNVSIFLSQGSDHPEVSRNIRQAVRLDDVPLVTLPRLPLAEYGALIDAFPKGNTIFIGLESMPAGHLAPSLGLKSIVLSDVRFYCRHYGPWGGLVVAHNDSANNRFFVRGVSTEAVLEAIERTKTKLAI